METEITVQLLTCVAQKVNFFTAYYARPRPMKTLGFPENVRCKNTVLNDSYATVMRENMAILHQSIWHKVSDQ